MRDGRTKKYERPGGLGSEARGFEGISATLVVIGGEAQGTEHTLDAPRLTVGRGPEADLVLRDEEMSQKHLSLEWRGDGFLVRDLGSTNGTRVNGEPVTARELVHGDRIEFGRHVLQLVLEKRDAPPPTYVLPDA